MVDEAPVRRILMIKRNLYPILSPLNKNNKYN